MSTLINRNVIAYRGRTSIRMEPEFWTAFEEVAQAQGIPLHELVRQAERRAVERGQGRTSAVRVYLLGWYRDRAQMPVAPSAMGEGRADA